MDGPSGVKVSTTPIHRPSSPPITPDSHEPLSATGSRAWQNSKRMMGGVFGSNLTFSPPSDEGEFHDSPSRVSTPELLSIPPSRSRQSSTSGISRSPARRTLARPELDSQSETETQFSTTHRRRRNSNHEDGLVIEELPDDDPRYMNRSGILRPNDVEDAHSERAPSPYDREETEMIQKFEDLYYSDEETKKTELQRLKKRREKRRSQVQVSKRTFSMSCGSDQDDEDTKTLDFNEVGASARRVKRRMGPANDPASSVFDDPLVEHITEVDEPEDEILIDAPPTYGEAVDWSNLRALPFFGVADPMRMDEDDGDRHTNRPQIAKEYD